MPSIRVRSTDGNNADDGSTWALAKADLHTATTGGLAAAGAGGICYVSQAHAQSTAAVVTLTLPGTPSSPTYVICGNDAADPPTSATTGASVATTGASLLRTVGSGTFRGITFKAGSGAVNAPLHVNDAATTGNSVQVFDTCVLEIVATGSACLITIGAAAASNNEGCRTILNDCTFKLINASAYMQLSNRVEINGGGLASGTNHASGLFRALSVSRFVHARVRDFDMTEMVASAALVDATRAMDFEARNCKMPASWTGGFITGTPAMGFRAALYNCDSGDTNYKLWIETYAGSIVDETTLVRTGGASDGTTALSWKLVTNANASDVFPLVSDPIYIWNETTGSSKTLTVEILHDSATNLTDAEAWVEVEYLGTSGVPLGSLVSDTRASILATAADQTTSSETWTTTGMTNPNKQALSVSFTPQEKGFAVARVYLAKASKTVYACPKATVS